MKHFSKLIIAFWAMLSMVVFSSCGSDGDDISGTTYTVNYNVDDVTGVIVDVIIYESDSKGKEVASNTMSNVKKGTSKQFTANDNSESLLITYKWTIRNKSTNHLVVEEFKLKSGKNITINLNNDTKIL